MTIVEAKMKQDEFNAKIADLNNYIPNFQKHIEGRKNLLDNAKNFDEGRKKIIEGFKNGILLLNHDDEFKEKQASKKFIEKEIPIKPTKLGGQELEIIKEKKQNKNNDLFKKYFNYQSPSMMYNVFK